MFERGARCSTLGPHAVKYLNLVYPACPIWSPAHHEAVPSSSRIPKSIRALGFTTTQQVTHRAEASWYAPGP
jgi:hypothetical protein